jgi:uncharacterized membrane protein YhhN
MGAALTTVCTAGLMLAEWRGSQAGKWATKPLAALGFVVAALGAGALASTYGQVVLAGLVLSLVGDLLLIPKSAKTFLGGLVAFLLGHVAFVVAFVVREPDMTRLLVALPLVLAVSGLALRWLAPHVEKPMKLPVVAYVLVISAMVVCAAGASARPGGLVGLAGALMFYASDLAVARDRFVAHVFLNRAWGLPLYFGGQLVIAASISA